MMIGLESITLGNDLWVESSFVESPFWHSLVRCCWSHIDSELSSPKYVTNKSLREKPWDLQHKAALQGDEQLLRVISLSMLLL